MPPTRYMQGGRERSDAERRAIFAKMGGRGRSGSADTRYQMDASGGREEGIYDGSKSRSETARKTETRAEWEARNPGKTMAEPKVVSAVLAPHPFGKIGSSMLAALKKLAPSLASGLGSVGLDSWNEKHPTANPIVKHYVAMGSTILGYVSAITGLTTLKSGVKLGASKIDVPIPGTGGAWLPLNEALALPFEKVGKIGSKIGALVDKVTPTKLKAGASSIYGIYNKISDITGATLVDLLNVTKNARASRIAGDLIKQGDEISTLANHLNAQQLTKVSDALDEAHRLSMANLPGAAKLYQEASAAYSRAARGSADSAKLAASMIELGTKMSAESRAGLVKAGVVIAGAVAKEIYDERDIGQMQKEATDAFQQGKSWTVPATKPMNKLEMALAITAGVHGNAAEKNFRYGGPELKQATAAYRAAYDMVAEAEASGELTHQAAEAARLKISSQAPKQLAGKAPWLFATAASAFIKWKIDDAIDKASRSTIDKRKIGSYIDGDTVEGASGKIYRLLDINTPEVAHDSNHDPKHPERRTGEFLGPESAAAADRLIKEGQHFRVVKDSHPEASGTTYGREVRTIETLPRPLDKLLAIPGLGKLIPAREFQEKMIRDGMGDIDYRELTKFKGDTLQSHDAARRLAQEAKAGIWSPEAQAAYAEYARTNANFTPWVGTELTSYDRKVNRAAKDGYTIPSTPQDESSTLWGAGLMATGQSGVFKSMNEWNPNFTGISGNIAAQAWNAYLAKRGLTDFNEKALRNPAPRTYRPPVGVPTDADRRDAAILAGTWRPE